MIIPFKIKCYSCRHKKLCDEALKYSFASVCVNPYYVKVCKEYLKDSPVKVATVVGFPLGATSMKTKIFEAKEAFEDGADEIDMVINIGALLEGNVDYVYEEIKTLLILQGV